MGVFEYQCSPYGIASGPGFFQSEMEIGIGRDRWYCRFMDDILISCIDTDDVLKKVFKY